MEKREYTVDEVCEIVRSWPYNKVNELSKKILFKATQSDIYVEECKKYINDLKITTSRSGKQVIVKGTYKGLNITRVFNGGKAMAIEISENYNLPGIWLSSTAKFKTLKEATDFIDNIDKLKTTATQLVEPFGFTLESAQKYKTIFSIDPSGYVICTENGWELYTRHISNTWYWRNEIPLAVPKRDMANTLTLITLTQTNDGWLEGEEIATPGAKIYIRYNNGIIIDLDGNKIGIGNTYTIRNRGGSCGSENDLTQYLHILWHKLSKEQREEAEKQLKRKKK